MEENMEENKEKPIQILPAEEQPKETKTKKEGRGVKIWLTVLTAAFTLSMISGLYLALTPGKTVRAAQTDKDISGKEEKSGSFFKKLSAEEGAAVVKIRGVIQEGGDSGFFSKQNSASAIAKRIRELADKKEVKALLLDINSPGGTVAAVQDIYNAILFFRSKNKPVVALFRDVAASGGFYIAMAADRIVAQPGTMTGSIGVIMQANNIEGLFDKLGIKVTPVKSGKHKDIGSAYRPMTEEEIALLQEMINETYQQFYQAVRQGRPNVDEQMLPIYADGRVFTGARAKEIGLIDALGGEETAQAVLAELTGIKDIKLVPARPNNFMDLIYMSGASMENKLGVSSKIEDFTTPKVSYLWTY